MKGTSISRPSIKAASTKLIFSCLLILSPVLSFAQEQMAAIAVISFARGSNSASQTGAMPRLIGKGSEIYQNDNIQTSIRSFVIISFNDGAKITVRPNSSFSITEYNNTQGQQQAILNLYKGGVRASSGEIARRDPEKFKIITPYATIKAQQAVYSVRVCQNDCKKETKQHKPRVIKKIQNVIARVVRIKGTVTAENKKTAEQKQQKKLIEKKEIANLTKTKVNTRAKTRNLTVGAPLYTADRLSSQKGSHALLAFRDGGKMTLQSGTEFEISSYYYQKEQTQDQAIFSLLRGGLRALTGRIGKVSRNDYKINTPVATMGIRGTGFDLHCEGNCEDGQDQQNPADKPTQEIINGQEDGLYSSVWQGAIDLTNEQGEFVLKAPDNSYIANQQFKPLLLKQLPRHILENPAPRPDKVEVDAAALFGSVALSGTPTGVYVSVHDGYVQLDNELPGEQNTTLSANSIDLGQDEVGYISPDGQIIRVDRRQLFDILDSYPLPSEFDEEQAEAGIYSLLADSYYLEAPAVYECVSQ